MLYHVTRPRNEDTCILGSAQRNIINLIQTTESTMVRLFPIICSMHIINSH